jgi:hypothetical protein
VSEARDVLTIAAVLFMMAIALVAAFIIFDQFRTKYEESITNSALNATSQDAIESLQGIDKVNNGIDYVFLALFIGFTLALMIVSWFVGGNAIFMFIYFVVVIVGVFVSIFFSNIWQVIPEKNAIMADAISRLPIMNYMMSHLPYFIGVVGIIGIIMMFAKPYSEG